MFLRGLPPVSLLSTCSRKERYRMAPPLRKPAGAQVAPLRCPILHCWQFYSIMAFRCSLLSQIRLSLTWGALYFHMNFASVIMLCRDKRNRKAPVVLSTDASISFHRIHDTTSSPGHGWDILGHTRTFQDILGHSWTFSDETSLLEATCKWKSQSVDSEIMTNRWKTGNGVI